jgi:hypothetical protein
MIDVATLTAILQRHDPADVAWAGDDEYDIESLAILELLTDEMEVPEVAALVQRVFARTFHPSVVPAADDALWREIAGEMMHDQRP